MTRSWAMFSFLITRYTIVPILKLSVEGGILQELLIECLWDAWVSISNSSLKCSCFSSNWLRLCHCSKDDIPVALILYCWVKILLRIDLLCWHYYHIPCHSWVGPLSRSIIYHPCNHNSPSMISPVESFQPPFHTTNLFITILICIKSNKRKNRDKTVWVVKPLFSEQSK